MSPIHATPPPGTNLDLFGPPVTAPADTAPCAAESADTETPDLVLVGDAGATVPDWQRDLFRHSAAEIAAHGARRALLARSAEQARQCLTELRALPAYARFVTDCEACIELLERCDPRWQAVARAVTWIETELAPAAERCVPGEAMHLLRPALQALLQAAQPATDTTGPHRAHPAYLWQLLGDPAQALAAIEAGPNWRSGPAMLVWHADLCAQAGLHSHALADVVELCLSWPDHAEQWLSSSAGWEVRWNAWCDLEDALPMHAFPAWARLRHTSELPIPDLDDARPGAALLRLADQLARNPSDLAVRKLMQRANPVLLNVFVAARHARDD